MALWPTHHNIYFPPSSFIMHSQTRWNAFTTSWGHKITWSTTINVTNLCDEIVIEINGYFATKIEEKEFYLLTSTQHDNTDGKKIIPKSYTTERSKEATLTLCYPQQGSGQMGTDSCSLLGCRCCCCTEGWCTLLWGSQTHLCAQDTEVLQRWISNWLQHTTVNSIILCV